MSTATAEDVLDNAALDELARERARQMWQQAGVSPANVDPQTSQFLRSMFASADPTTLEFAAGAQLIKDFAPVRRAPNVTVIHSKFGGELSCMRTEEGRDFIGLTAAQARKQPLTEQQANEIATLAQGAGWKALTLTGSAAEKDMLWLAARKLGLAVEGHNPGPEAAAAYNAFAETLKKPVVDSAFMRKPASAASDNIIDAEFRVLEDRRPRGNPPALEGPKAP